MEHEPDITVKWTGVGGLPFQSLSEAVDHVLVHYPHMPFLPEPSVEGGGLLTDALPPSLGRVPHAGFGVKLTTNFFGGFAEVFLETFAKIGLAAEADHVGNFCDIAGALAD